VHLRPPAFDHGVVSFVWGVALGVFIWLGLVGIGISKPTAFIVSFVAACGIFLFVRLRGEDPPGGQATSRRERV
jgi:hypothetical protein